MSGSPNAQHLTAVTSVLGTPELLEMILLDVAHADIEFINKVGCKLDWRTQIPSCKLKHLHAFGSHFIWAPIILRAVSRDFRDLIDGSFRLLRLRLRAIPPKAPWIPKSFLIGDDMGPLHWFQSRLGYHRSDGPSIKKGVLKFRARVFGTHGTKRMKLHNDKQGSWRTIPCVEKPGAVTKVVIHFYKVFLKPLPQTPGDRRVFSTCHERRLCSCDLGSRPTLGEIFDAIHAAESRYCSFPLIRKEGGSKCQCQRCPEPRGLGQTQTYKRA